jgi:hypothetical protein
MTAARHRKPCQQAEPVVKLRGSLLYSQVSTSRCEFYRQRSAVQTLAYFLYCCQVLVG